MRVASRDGTSIDVDVTGEGPPVVLVTGGSVDRTANLGLAGELASDPPIRPRSSGMTR